MSQVHYDEVRVPLSTLFEDDDSERPSSRYEHVLLVRPTLTWDEFRSVEFPKETHWNQEGASRYTEPLREYEVVSVLFSSSFSAGDRFWEWQEPNYSERMVRQYHEQGLSRSPSILSRVSDHPIEGDERYVLLRRHTEATETHPVVFVVVAEEGLSAKDELLRLLSVRRRRWWQFWKRR